MVGWWISQLNSAYVEPSAILKAYQENNNPTEFYNSKLGMAYIAAENRLSISDVYAACGQDAMLVKESNPCAAGIDVGATLHVVIGFKPRERTLEICHLARVSSFNDVHDLCKRFNVQFAVIDREPETRKALDFAASESFPVFLCDYQESVKGAAAWDEAKMLIRVNRTEILDSTHDLFMKPGSIILPRRCEEVDIFADQVRNCVKILEEDQETGSRAYRYRKTGPDHFRHALAYFLLASERIRVSDARFDRFRTPLKAETDFDPLADGYGREQKPFDW